MPQNRIAVIVIGHAPTMSITSVRSNTTSSAAAGSPQSISYSLVSSPTWGRMLRRDTRSNSSASSINSRAVGSLILGTLRVQSDR
jgi:hypothetical protein